MVEGGGVWNAYPRRRIYDAAEANVAVSAGSLRRTRDMAEGSGAQGACSLRRNCTLAEGNRPGDAGSRRRYCTVIICDRRRWSPWARNRGYLCCLIAHASNRCTSILRNKRGCPRQCCQRTGRVCCTAVKLSLAGAEGTWLACIRVSARSVGSIKAHSGRSRERRRGGRWWDITMVSRRVWGTGGTDVTVYLAVSWWYPRVGPERWR